MLQYFEDVQRARGLLISHYMARDYIAALALPGSSAGVLIQHPRSSASAKANLSAGETMVGNSPAASMFSASGVVSPASDIRRRGHWWLGPPGHLALDCGSLFGVSCPSASDRSERDSRR